MNNTTSVFEIALPVKVYPMFMHKTQEHVISELEPDTCLLVTCPNCGHWD